MACLNKLSLFVVAGVLITLALCDGAEVKKSHDLDENHFEEKKRGELLYEAKRSVNKEDVAKRALKRLMSIKRSSLDKANFGKNIQYNIDPYESDSFSDESNSVERYQDSDSVSSSFESGDDDDDDSFEYKKRSSGLKRKRGGYKLWKHAKSNLKKKH